MAPIYSNHFLQRIPARADRRRCRVSEIPRQNGSSASILIRRIAMISQRFRRGRRRIIHETISLSSSPAQQAGYLSIGTSIRRVRVIASGALALILSRSRLARYPACGSLFGADAGTSDASCLVTSARQCSRHIPTGPAAPAALSPCAVDASPAGLLRWRQAEMSRAYSGHASRVPAAPCRRVKRAS